MKIQFDARTEDSMGDFLFVPLIVLAFLWGLWGLFVFLPIKRSETKARQDFEQALENQRRMFERQLNTLRFELEKERAQNAPPTSAKVDKPEPTFEPATFAKSVSTPATPVVEREPVGIAPQPLVLEQNVESEPEFTPVAPEPAEQVERVDDESRGADLKPLALDSKALPTEDPFAEAIQEEVEPVRVVESAQTRPAQEFELPKEKTRNLDSLETLVGRKIFSWAGAFLFVVGVVFFLQIAASRGWLSPTVRFGGVVALGAVSAFGYGRWAGFRPFGMPALEFFDSAMNVLTPVAAALICVFVGWVLRPKRILAECQRDGSRVGFKVFYVVMVKFVAPLLVLAILVSEVCRTFGIGGWTI